jgi:hypothetical protein
VTKLPDLTVCFFFLNLDLYFKIDELKSMLTAGGAEILSYLDSLDTRQVLGFSLGIVRPTTNGPDPYWECGSGSRSKEPKLINKPEYIYHLKFNFVRPKSLTRIRIQNRISWAPWIRIRIETNADPQHSLLLGKHQGE